MLAVDQLRGEQGSDLVVEIVLHDLLVDLAHVVDVQHLDVLGAQQLPERGPGALGDGVDGLDLSADGRDLSGGIQAGFVIQLIRLQNALVVQRADPHHEELVQVGKVDGQKLQALHQRDVGVERFAQDPVVKFQPAQLAVDKDVGTGRLRRGDRFGIGEMVCMICLFHNCSPCKVDGVGLNR